MLLDRFKLKIFVKIKKHEEKIFSFGCFFGSQFSLPKGPAGMGDKLGDRSGDLFIFFLFAGDLAFPSSIGRQRPDSNFFYYPDRLIFNTKKRS